MDNQSENGRIFFMSRPSTTAGDRRTWLVRLTDQPSYLVRVYPDPENANNRTFVCDCKGKHGPAANYETCQHIMAAVQVDYLKF